MITNVYVDGFNLYYGCLKGSPFKWLDLGKLCADLLPQNEIKRIRYFTAKISARPADEGAPRRQQAHLGAHSHEQSQLPVQMPGTGLIRPTRW